MSDEKKLVWCGSLPSRKDGSLPSLDGHRASARHVLQNGGSRVIRYPDEPWGAYPLSLRELEQMIMGNLLLGFALACMVLLALSGGSGILDHPKDPGLDHMVSSGDFGSFISFLDFLALGL